MTEFAEYSHALVSMALFVLMTLVMSPLTALPGFSPCASTRAPSPFR